LEKSVSQKSRKLSLNFVVSWKKFAKLTTCTVGCDQRTVTKLRIFVDCMTMIRLTEIESPTSLFAKVIADQTWSQNSNIVLSCRVSALFSR